MDARERDLSDLAENLSIASDALKALEAAKPWRCPKAHIADRRINALVRHTNRLIDELVMIFSVTGIERPSEATVDQYR